MSETPDMDEIMAEDDAALYIGAAALLYVTRIGNFSPFWKWLRKIHTDSKRKRGIQPNATCAICMNKPEELKRYAHDAAHLFMEASKLSAELGDTVMNIIPPSHN